MNKGGRNHNAGAKVSDHQIDVERYSKISHTCGQDREHGRDSGDEENDKHGRDTSAMMTFVVLDTAVGGEIANDVFRVDRMEIDMRWIKRSIIDRRMLI